MPRRGRASKALASATAPARCLSGARAAHTRICCVSSEMRSFCPTVCGVSAISLRPSIFARANARATSESFNLSRRHI